MKVTILTLISAISLNAFGIGCDCDVRIFSPMTGLYQSPPMNLKTYKLKEFSNYSIKNQNICRNECLEEFEKDMSSDRLKALLLTYSQDMIQQQVLGYNCTGLTTLKYPVRVKARLGEVGLGNVVDIIQVVTHEEACF